MDDFTASREFYGVTASNESFLLCVRVGRPRRVSAGEWRCSVELGRLVPEAGDCFGADSWQALQLAVDYVHCHLRHFLERGGRLYYPAETGEENDPDDRAQYTLKDFPDYLARTA